MPGLDAKPVIDLLVGVRNIWDAKHCVRPLERIEYSFWAEDPNLSHHRLFVKFVDVGMTAKRIPGPNRICLRCGGEGEGFVRVERSE